MKTKNIETLEEYLNQVDRYLLNIIGMTHEDIGDFLYADYFEDKVHPARCAKDVLEQNDIY